MKTDEFKNSIFYRAACSCGSHEHDVSIEFEIDEDIPTMLILNFHKKIAWCSHWGNVKWYDSIWKRIKSSVTMLFTGYIELEESFIIQGEDDIDSFIVALVEGKSYIKKKMWKDE